MTALFETLLTRRAFMGLVGVTAGSALAGSLMGCSGKMPTVSTQEEPETQPETQPKAKSEAQSETETEAKSASQTQTSSPSDSDVASEASTAENASETSAEEEPGQSKLSEEEAPEQEESSEEETAMTNTKTAAVVYFSMTGNTEAVANKVAAAVGATPQIIVPAEPYTAADIDYNSDCRANVEQQDDLSIRPELASPIPDAAGADVVFLGYPIWWGKVPRVILTYVESGTLGGKTVIPFCTSGSSGINGSLSELQAADTSVNWQDGRRFDAGVSESDIQAFVAPYVA